jgi:hypothetical protein
MASPIEAAAITLDFCHAHLNYPGAGELAKAIRE